MCILVGCANETTEKQNKTKPITQVLSQEEIQLIDSASDIELVRYLGSLYSYPPKSYIVPNNELSFVKDKTKDLLNAIGELKEEYPYSSISINLGGASFEEPQLSITGYIAITIKSDNLALKIRTEGHVLSICRRYSVEYYTLSENMSQIAKALEELMHFWE